MAEQPALTADSPPMSAGDRLCSLMQAEYKSGLGQFERSGNRLAELAFPDLVEPSRIALIAREPILFAHLAGRLPLHLLDQIALGHRLLDTNEFEIYARTNSTGVICLPGLGIVATDRADAECVLTGRASDWQALWLDSSDAIAVELQTSRHVAGTIEVDRDVHPAFEALFPECAGAHRHGRPDEGNLTLLDEAFAILEHVAPTLFAMISEVTKRIILTANPGAASFAANAAFGAAFINVVDDQATELFFVEEIAHQCGHILFSAITKDTGEFLRLPPDTMLRSVGGAADDPRNLYEALHGAFTEATMAIAFNGCLERAIFSGDNRRELLGRFGLIMRKMNQDLVVLAQPFFYHAKGAEWFEALNEVFQEMEANWLSELQDLDFREQPYVFDRRIFSRCNPLN